MESSNWILVEDLFDKHGRLLLSKGIPISEEMIDLLQKRGLLDKLVLKGDPKSVAREVPKTSNEIIEHFDRQKIRDFTAVHAENIFKRTPLIKVELAAKASSQVAELIYLSRKLPWGLPLNALFNQVPWVYSHSVNVTILACTLGYWLDLKDDCVQTIAIGALLHDVGKILIPLEIINKPGKLTEDEWSLIKTHPRVGYSMLESYDLSKTILDIILQHHERLDGKGYPDGINGPNLSLPVQIVAIADKFDGVTSVRPYHPARNLREAFEILEDNRDICFASYLFDEFKKVLGFSFL